MREWPAAWLLWYILSVVGNLRWTGDRLKRKIAFCCVFALSMAVIILTPLGQRLEREFGLSALYTLRGKINPPAGALIIGLDRASVGWLQREAWNLGERAPSLDRCLTSRAKEEISQARNVNHVPRGLHACLLGSLSATRPKLIIFDINFNVEKPEDVVLGRAIRDAANVLLLEKIVRTAPGANPDDSVITVRLRPVKLLREAALGTVGFQVDGSGVDVTTGYVRRFAEFPDLNVLPVAAWAHYAHSDYPAGQHGAAVQRIWLYGPAGTIPTWSLREVLDRNSARRLPENLSEMVVFVGASDLAYGTSDDHFKVPLAGGGKRLISGVELAATAFLNLLHNQTLSSLSVAASAALLFGYAAVLGVVGVYFTSARGPLLIILLTGAYAAAAAMLFVTARVWMPIILPVVLTTPMALLLTFERRYRVARSLVVRLVPRQFAEILLDDPGADRQAVHDETSTVMFIDLAHSVSIGERMTPLDFAAIMGRYYDNANSAIDANRGGVIGYRGDGIVVIFTESFAGEDHAARACFAALAICAQNARDNVEYARLHGAELHLRLGLNTGPVAVGRIGPPGRFNIDILGDDVHVAARLEQHGKEIERRGRDVVLVSEAVREKSGLSDAYFEPLGWTKLRGRTASTLIYRLQEPEATRRV